MAYDYDMIDSKAGTLTERGSIALAIMRERLGEIHSPAKDCETNGATLSTETARDLAKATCERCWSAALSQARKLAGALEPFDWKAAERYGPMALLHAGMTDLEYALRYDEAPDEMGRVYKLRYPV